MRRTLLKLALGALVGLAGSLGAKAQTYPSRPVTIITAFTPGGPSDLLARIVGKKLSDVLGQPFVIEGRPGGGGNIAAEFVSRSKPDGYTLLLGNNSILATNKALYKKLGYDPEKDFRPISFIGTQPNILVLSPKVPAKTMAELIALGKAQPGKLSYASSSFGAAAHLAAELFKKEAGIDMAVISYKGAAPALQDVIAGEVDVMFATAASVIGHIKSGTLRALAVTTPKRTPLLPDMPTVAELGLPGFDATTWHGLVAPAATPADVIQALHRATVTALQDPETKKSLTDLGVDIVGSTPEEFDAYVKSEIPKWTAILEASGAKIE